MATEKPKGAAPKPEIEPLDPKTDGASANILEENIERLKELFPEIVTEGKIDLDALRETLGDYVDDRPERYSFTWHGKSRARRIAQTPSIGTLRPCLAESVDWDTTQNIFIEGDNLEVLKLLQKPYHKRVKMIYIDPPYNTGNEFIYPDKYADNLETYLKYTGQVDDAGFKLTPNAETSGRYHTNWLNMMYPRLKLARNVLRDDGVILISIDDHEVHHLRELCNEIFGEEHFLGCITWKRRQVPDNRNLNGVSTDHEYVLAYTRSTGRFLGEEKDLSKYANPDNDPRGPWMSDNLTGLASQDQRPNLHYDIVNPETGISYPPHPGRGWAYEPKRMKSLIEEQRILWPKQPTGRPRLKRFLNELSENTTGFSTVQNPGFTTDGTREVTALLGFKAFDFPKPLRLLTDLISQICNFNTGDIILDFFAGSGTTGHAALQLNSSDSGNRRFILVQLPEPCSEESEAFKRGFKTIAQIGEERIRRAIAEISNEESQEAGNGLKQPPLTMTHGPRLDHGMRIFKLDASNIKRWDVDLDNLHAELLDAVENIKLERSESDVLHELLLKVGLDLATAIEQRQIDGKAVFVVGAGALVVCLARPVTLELAEGVAALKKELQPEVMRVVFRDSGFEDDVIKTNAVQILRQAGIEDIKSL